GGKYRQSGFGQDLLAEFDIRAFEAHHERHRKAHLLRGGDDAVRDDVAFHDAAEDVDENAFHMRIGDDDLEGRGDLFLAGAAADIEEVRRLAAVKLDDVHRRHGEARAIDHAADLAVELDVGEIELRRLDLHRFLLVEIAQLLNILMTVKRVVVEIDLGIEADDFAVLGHDQRIDLQKTHVLRDEGLVKASNHAADLLGLLALELERRGDVVSDIGRIACRRLDLEGLDLFRRLMRHFLDVHAALGRGDEGDVAGGTIDEGGKIEFALDRRAVLDVETFDDAALRPRLMRDEPHAEHAPGFFFDILDGLDDFHAAALAAAAGMDLRFHDPHRAAQIFCRRDGFGDAEGGLAARHGSTEATEDVLGLIFMDVHREPGTLGWRIARHNSSRPCGCKAV